MAVGTGTTIVETETTGATGIVAGSIQAVHSGVDGERSGNQFDCRVVSGTRRSAYITGAKRRYRPLAPVDALK
jgi:hypothetical protein